MKINLSAERALLIGHVINDDDVLCFPFTRVLYMWFSIVLLWKGPPKEQLIVFVFVKMMET